MIRIYSKLIREALVNVWPLYGSAFAMAMSINLLWTTMPFIMRNIGGTEEHVGYIWAFNMLGYMLCLLLAAVVFGHLPPRYATRAASAVMFLSTIVMVIMVYYAIDRGQYGRPALIWAMIAAGTLSGAAMSLFWPYLMSWVSADYEGPVLNRRLGTYNGMWSSAAIIGPLIGGVLVDIITLGPIVVSSGCLVVCFILVCLAHDGSAGSAVSVRSVDSPENSLDHDLLLRFKWMARLVQLLGLHWSYTFSVCAFIYKFGIFGNSVWCTCHNIWNL